MRDVTVTCARRSSGGGGGGGGGGAVRPMTFVLLSLLLLACLQTVLSEYAMQEISPIDIALGTSSTPIPVVCFHDNFATAPTNSITTDSHPIVTVQVRAVGGSFLAPLVNSSEIIIYYRPAPFHGALNVAYLQLPKPTQPGTSLIDIECRSSVSGEYANATVSYRVHLLGATGGVNRSPPQFTLTCPHHDGLTAVSLAGTFPPISTEELNYFISTNSTTGISVISIASQILQPNAGRVFLNFTCAGQTSQVWYNLQLWSVARQAPQSIVFSCPEGDNSSVPIVAVENFECDSGNSFATSGALAYRSTVPIDLGWKTFSDSPLTRQIDGGTTWMYRIYANFQIAGQCPVRLTCPSGAWFTFDFIAPLQPAIGGATGEKGEIGNSGPIGHTGLGFSSRGTWSSTVNYTINDVVVLNGSSYVATSAVLGVAPDTSITEWNLVASHGAVGMTGPTGATGLGFTVRGVWSSGLVYAINDVVTYSGSSYVSLTIQQSNQPNATSSVWHLIASIGDVGATGAAGPMGVAGSNGTDGAIGATGATGPAGVDGRNGSIGATGPQGIQGPTGPSGKNGTDGAVGATGATGATGPAGDGNLVELIQVNTTLAGAIDELRAMVAALATTVASQQSTITAHTTTIAAHTTTIDAQATTISQQNLTITRLAAQEVIVQQRLAAIDTRCYNTSSSFGSQSLHQNQEDKSATPTPNNAHRLMAAQATTTTTDHPVCVQAIIQPTSSSTAGSASGSSGTSVTGSSASTGGSSSTGSATRAVGTACVTLRFSLLPPLYTTTAFIVNLTQDLSLALNISSSRIIELSINGATRTLQFCVSPSSIASATTPAHATDRFIHLAETGGLATSGGTSSTTLANIDASSIAVTITEITPSTGGSSSSSSWSDDAGIYIIIGVVLLCVALISVSIAIGCWYWRRERERKKTAGALAAAAGGSSSSSAFGVGAAVDFGTSHGVVGLGDDIAMAELR